MIAQSFKVLVFCCCFFLIDFERDAYVGCSVLIALWLESKKKAKSKVMITTYEHFNTHLAAICFTNAILVRGDLFLFSQEYIYFWGELTSWHTCYVTVQVSIISFFSRAYTVYSLACPLSKVLSYYQYNVSVCGSFRRIWSVFGDNLIN